MSKDLDGARFATQADERLAPYAQHNATSRGRQFEEVADPFRLPFQRDRDRIIHTTSFRRLQGKMQVVRPRKGDHFRNRLTHTIEVSQIARDLARQLRLNEDLAEAIALAHDLGHPPFGHSGETALDQKMKEHDRSFDHNGQSLRVVTFFENRYQDFPGLNLNHEVLEGIQKHTRGFDREGAQIFFPHLESQLVDLADEIAYLSADIEDGLRGEFFTLEQLKESEIASRAIASLDPSEKSDRSALIRRVMRHLLEQLVSDTQHNIETHNIQTLSDVQQCSHHIVAFEKDYFAQFLDLKKFLMTHYYCAPEVEAEKRKGQEVLGQIFDYLIGHPEAIPSDFHPAEDRLQRICDYIAGMTDSFAEEFLEM